MNNPLLLLTMLTTFAICGCKAAQFSGKNSKEKSETGANASSVTPSPAAEASPAVSEEPGFDLKVIRYCSRKGTFYPLVSYNCVQDSTEGVIVKLRNKSGKITAYTEPALAKKFRDSITEKGTIRLDVPHEFHEIAFCDAANARCKDPSRFDNANQQFNKNGVIGYGTFDFVAGTKEIDTQKSRVRANFAPNAVFAKTNSSPLCDEGL